MPLPQEILDRRRRANVNYFDFWTITDPSLIEYVSAGLYAYKGKDLDNGVGAPGQLRTLNPMDVSDPLGLTQFEVRLQEIGLSNTITIGVASDNYPCDFLPGWKSPEGTAVGVDAADGLLYHDTDDGLQQYVQCKTGDVMKCTLVALNTPPNSVSVEFYHNDRLVTTVTAEIPKDGFYGVIGLASPGECIVIGPPQREEAKLFDDLFELKTPYVTHNGNGTCTYVPPESPTKHYSTLRMDEAPPMYIGTIRSIKPVDPGDRLDIKLLNKGEESAIAIGLCTNDYSIDSMPGWEEHSLAYHADIHSILNGTSDKELIAEWKEGTILSCSVESTDGSELRVIYRKERDIIWKDRLRITSNSTESVYWCIGLMSKGECIQVLLPRKILPLDIQKSPFEEVWQLPSPTVEVTQNGICLYVKQGETPGIIRSREPINPLSPFPFFDVKIINFGREGEIILGVVSSNYPTNEMPGWKSKSISFQCSTGNLYHSTQFPTKTEHFCNPGDVVRCVVSPIDGCAKNVDVCFYRNGTLVTKMMDWTPVGGFHAQIGMLSEGEVIQVASPAMVPSSLKQGLVGFRPELVKPLREEVGGAKKRPFTAPIKSEPSFDHITSPSDQVDFPPRDYKYVPPVSPHVTKSVIQLSGGERRSPRSGPILASSEKRRSLPVSEPRQPPGNLGKFESGNDPEFLSQSLPLISTTPSTPPAPSSATPSSKPVTPSSKPATPTTPDTPSSKPATPTTPATPYRPTIPATPTTPTTPYRPAPPTTPATPTNIPIIEEEEFELYKSSKLENRYFSCLHNISYTSSTGILTVNDSISDSRYAYAVGRKTLTEKTSYFEIDFLTSPVSGIAVGVSSGRLLGNQLLGTYADSVSLLTCSGKVYNSNENCVFELERGEGESDIFKQGDTLGCGVEIITDTTYRPEDNKNLYSPCQIRIHYYKNAALLTSINTHLAPSSLYPSLCFDTPKSSVKFICKYKMKPCDYFNTRPVPDGYRNFPQPSPLPLNNGWSLSSSQDNICDFATESHHMTRLSSKTGRNIYQPVIVQHYLPFSLSNKYFEIELTGPSSSYSVVCMGASTNTVSLPGEGDDSIGFYPLTGLVMRKGGVVSYIQDQIVSKAASSRGSLRVGIGLEINPSSFNEESRNVVLFFTINGQEVSKLVCTFPTSGYFHPTLAIQPQSSRLPVVDHTLCHLVYPAQWPCSSNSIVSHPWCIARLSTGFQDACSTFLHNETNEIKGAQLCFPLSPSRSYFQVVVLSSSDYIVSVGVSPLLHPLDLHIGLGQHSIGYLVDKGGVFHNGLKVAETPVYNLMGVTIGCGALFAEDGSRGNAEIYFVVNGTLISRNFVHVPSSGLFPSLTFAQGIVTLDFDSPSPFPEMKYSSEWAVLDNVLATNHMIQLVSHAHIGMAQLVRYATSNETIYFRVRLPSSLDAGKVLIGYSNCLDSPFTPKVSPTNRSMFIELSTGTIIIIHTGQRRSDECVIPKGTSEVGCGISPISSNANSSLVFFTADNQMIYSTRTSNISQVMLRPIICMVGTTSKMRVDACPLWPPVSPVGVGWGRFHNVQFNNGCLVPTSTSSKSEIGFVQSSTPLIPSRPYFEVEVISRDPKKAIAVGLASRQYNHAHWLGWKQETISYHLDDGRLYKANGIGTTCGPKLFQDDTIGCGIVFPNDTFTKGARLEVFFTINGHRLPKSELMTIPEGGLFPTVCLESESESVNIQLTQCPSGLHRLNNTLWSRSYCISQAGNILEHSLSLKLSPYPEGFCQAKEPVSTQHCFFEVEILSFGDKSNLSIGLAPLQPYGSQKIVNSSVMFNISGIIIVSEGGGLVPTATRQKCDVGDRIGCRLRPSNNQTHLCVEFSRNNMKVMFTPLPASLRDRALYPTIVLTQPEDSVVPLLCAPPPSNVPSQQIGWSRIERVKTKGAVVEYAGLGPSTPRSVGVAQMNIPLNRNHPYYEIEILNTGDKCMIAIGAAALDHPLSQQPGWVRGSIGHHGDDGRLFYESGTGCGFGPPWRKHEVIGLGIRPYLNGVVSPGDECQIFITRNGKEIGHMSTVIPESGLFPTVGFHGKGEKIKINHSVSQSNTLIKSRLRWRTLIGIKHTYSMKQEHDVLTYLDSLRSIPFGLIYPTGLAISYEPFSEDRSYFEVHLLSLGKLKAIAIGATSKSYSSDLVPGWGEGSVAYHTDTGALHHASGAGKNFGPIATKGDTVGCGITLTSTGTHCTVFFTINGIQVGHRVQAGVPKDGFYPAIGFVSPNDKVSVKFLHTFKPRPIASDSLVGLMRILNSSYSDNLLTFSASMSSGPANAQFAVSLNNSRNYYRVIIIKKKDNIKIGLAPHDYPLTHPPGSSSYSVAYDVTDGSIKGVFGRAVVSERVCKCKQGDVVGCGVTVTEEGEGEGEKNKSSIYHVFFTCNDTLVKRIQLPDLCDDLFPIVGFLPSERKSAVYMDWSVSSFDLRNVL